MVIYDAAKVAITCDFQDSASFSGLWSWNLERVTERSRSRMGWSVDFAALVEREYRRFMALGVIATGKTLGMRGPVDELWHEHILFTRDYASFCNSIAGKFIHHEPAEDGAPKGVSSYQLTLLLLEQHFGTAPREIWPAVGNASCGGDNCAMCDKADVDESIH